MDQSKWQLSTKAGSDSFYAGLNPKITFPELASASQGLGFLNITADHDGILRQLPLLVRYRGAYYPSLSFKAICDYLNVSRESIFVDPGKSITLKNVKLPNATSVEQIVIPIDHRGNFLINYSPLHGQSIHYSYREILQASDDATKLDKLRNELSSKIVILSEAVEQGFAIRPNKAEKRLSSGQIHSIVLQNILTQSFLKKISGTSMFLIELAMLTIILSLSVRFSSTPLSLTAIGATGVFCLLGIFSLIYFTTIFQFVRPLLTMILALSFLLVYTGFENALEYAEAQRARKIAERELEIGRQIQADFFPTALPKPDGWELITHFQAARHVGGDFYDVFTLGEEKKIGIVVADICDKGVGAALFMALFRSLIRVLSGQAGNNNHLDEKRSVNDPQETLAASIRSINNYISVTHEDAGMFATMFYGILDPKTGELHYINGGHEPPAILNRAGAIAWLSPTGPAVGLYPHLGFEVSHITLQPDETLLLFTDGVIDAQNKSGESFSKNRLTKILNKSYPTARNLIDAILNQINAHIADQDHFDDITIVALRRTAPSQ
jgi:serine phosphatase RsbU (regulator of sigma subunit)